MRLVALYGRREHAIVDDEDYGIVASRTWHLHSGGYAHANLDEAAAVAEALRARLLPFANRSARGVCQEPAITGVPGAVEGDDRNRTGERVRS